jgi:hypothetical protein
MTPKSWSVILAFEILTVFFVMVLFLELDHQIAGLIAGFFFGLLGLGVGFQLWRRKTLKSFTFWWLFVYLGYSVIPMWVRRWKTMGTNFADIQVWGMAGPEFHRVSERIYLILIVATALDLMLAWWSTRKRTK